MIVIFTRTRDDVVVEGSCVLRIDNDRRTGLYCLYVWLSGFRELIPIEEFSDYDVACGVKLMVLKAIVRGDTEVYMAECQSLAEDAIARRKEQAILDAQASRPAE